MICHNVVAYISSIKGRQAFGIIEYVKLFNTYHLG
jgi:hypothetical protein